MKLSEKEYIVLFSLIKFYPRPQNEKLIDFYGNELFSKIAEYFKSELELFVNKKIALDRIYNSLNNASQTYAIFRQMEGNGNINAVSENDKSKMFMAFNESFISALIINFSKLREVLNFKKNVIINDEELFNKFSYLNELNNRIGSAKVTDLRNGWFAHAYEKERDGIVYRDKDIKKNVINVLRALCDEKHRIEFDSSSDRLNFFCEKYLFEGYTTYNIQSIISDLVNNTKVSLANVSTKAKELPHELHKFSMLIRDVKLFGVESFFIVEDSEIEKWSENPSAYFKSELKGLNKLMGFS
ncbi:MAG: hypothetical protein LBV11_13145 [Bacillus cereus]|jgi:hypothetical protein|nr:hypothetical protein [Bacillus cereus]